MRWLLPVGSMRGPRLLRARNEVSNVPLFSCSILKMFLSLARGVCFEDCLAMGASPLHVMKILIGVHFRCMSWGVLDTLPDGGGLQFHNHENSPNPRTRLSSL